MRPRRGYPCRTDAGRVREQVGDRDRTARGHERSADFPLHGHSRLGVRGDEPADGHARRKATLLHQREDSRARERLGLRGDPEDRIDPHGTVRFFVAPPQRPFVNRLAIPKYQGNDARDAVLIDVLLQHGIQACETLPRDAVNRGRGWFRGRSLTGGNAGGQNENEKRDHFESRHSWLRLW